MNKDIIYDKRWGWVNPDEKLPENAGFYLAFVNHIGPITVYYCPKEGWDDYGSEIIMWCKPDNNFFDIE